MREQITALVALIARIEEVGVRPGTDLADAVVVARAALAGAATGAGDKADAMLFAYAKALMAESEDVRMRVFDAVRAVMDSPGAGEAQPKDECVTPQVLEGVTVAGARAFWALKDLEKRHEALRVAVMTAVSDPHGTWETLRWTLTEALNNDMAVKWTQPVKWTCGGCGHGPHGPVCLAGEALGKPAVCGCTGQPEHDVVCEHGTAADVHCCNCHSGFVFNPTHEEGCICG